jgi:SNF family Na+-dependent transporter
MMETALGQFSRKGPVGCWDFAPAMRGIGIASVIISFFGALYYVMIMVWGGLYLMHSFCSIGSRLPWADDVGNSYFLLCLFLFVYKIQSLQMTYRTCTRIGRLLIPSNDFGIHQF